MNNILELARELNLETVSCRLQINVNTKDEFIQRLDKMKSLSEQILEISKGNLSTAKAIIIEAKNSIDETPVAPTVYADNSFPDGEFTIKEHSEKSGISYPSLYIKVKEAVSKGILKECGKVAPSGRGKPTTKYCKV